jgi:hypothetical protein
MGFIMDKKLNWLQTITQYIGLSEIIAFIIGVPAMITLVATVWHKLSLEQQIIVGIMSGLIVVVVVLFIYAQTRKILYIIPDLLYKRHLIAREHASCIKITDLSEGDFYKAYKLIDIDFSNLVSANNLSEFRIRLDALYSQIKKRGISEEDTENFCNYLSKKTGLQQLLEKDESYVNLGKKLYKIRLLIPTEDMISAVGQFIKKSNSANSLFPLIQVPDEIQTEIFPLKLEADFIGIGEKLDDEVAVYLVKVRESIDKYYRK